MTRPVRTLVFSTLFPSESRPHHGIFVETRLRELLAHQGVEARVVAPVPWFHSTDPRHGEHAAMARTPVRENRHGLDVLHPRYLVIPKIGMTLAPLLLALGALPAMRQLRAEGFDFDLIDAHYYYPDGVAASLLARWFDRPLTITARGTDLNLIPQHTLPRLMMQWAARQAAVSIGVCKALVDVLRGWGIEESRLQVMRNGVDLQRFRPLDREQMRAELGVVGSPMLLSVGHLIERKGHHVAIEALAALTDRHPRACLYIVGEGGQRLALQALATHLGMADRVVLVGQAPNTELARWYSAADVLVLASSREGWPNVLLESMACGTPVAATRIWGTPEVVGAPEAGRLVDQRTGAAFADVLDPMLREPMPREQVRHYAEGYSWEATSRAQLEVMRRLAWPRVQQG